MSRYRPKESHISKDPALREKQLANLLQGRKKRPLDSSIEPLRGPFYPYRGNYHSIS